LWLRAYGVYVFVALFAGGIYVVGETASRIPLRRSSWWKYLILLTAVGLYLGVVAVLIKRAIQTLRKPPEE
jgi:hypothetical protein